MNALRLGVGIVAILVGLGRIYITLEPRASGQSISAFGIVVGAFFAVMGLWFAVSAKAAR